MDADPDPKLDPTIESILDSYRQLGELSHLGDASLPSREAVRAIVDDLLKVLFPGFLEAAIPRGEIAARTAERVRSIARRLADEIENGLRLHPAGAIPEPARGRKARAAAGKLLASISAIRRTLSTDIDAAYQGDPAATTTVEIIIAYPGLQAIAVQRLAHVLYEEQVPLVPRVMTEYAHSRTGIDIHPGARIGNRFFIDHGTGVVIGETTTIGDNVKIYQGVTLGARSFPTDDSGRIIKGTKRHPDIESGVTIYSGATILGDVRIGQGSLIGGNVWLVHSVPPQTRILVRPPQQIQRDQSGEEYQI